MKKAIVILTILSLIIIGVNTYIGFGYANALDTLKETSKNKSEIMDTNGDLEIEISKLEIEYNQKIQDLLNENNGCMLWKNLNEIMNQTKE